MRRRKPGRGNPATAFLAAGLVLAGSALHSAAVGARGKAAQRERIGKASHYLEHMIVAVPPQSTQPGQPQAAAPATGQMSRTALGLIALCAWLITVALGLRMMARWILRSRARHTPAGRLRRPPASNFAHLGLAIASLLIWIAYLATGVTGLAWTARALLTLVMGLGMTLVFLPHSARPASSATARTLPAATAHALPAATARPSRDPARSRRPPVFAVGAHIAFATATILFAFLAAVGTG